MQIGKIALRVTQLLLMAVVIGLSASLVKQQVTGSAPSITTWSLVCGIWGVIVAIVGITSIFIESLQKLPMVILDGLATLFFLSGSIAMAVKLGVGSCTAAPPDEWIGNGVDASEIPNAYCALRDIIVGGAIKGSVNEAGWISLRPNSWFVSRCQLAQADVAFLFFALFAFAAAFVLSVLTWRRSGKKLTAI